MPKAESSLRKQLNVRLPADLVLRVKHAAIDIGESQQGFIEEAVRERLRTVSGAVRKDEESYRV